MLATDCVVTYSHASMRSQFGLSGLQAASDLSWGSRVARSVLRPLFTAAGAKTFTRPRSLTNSIRMSRFFITPNKVRRGWRNHGWTSPIKAVHQMAAGPHIYSAALVEPGPKCQDKMVSTKLSRRRRAVQSWKCWSESHGAACVSEPGVGFEALVECWLCFCVRWWFCTWSGRIVSRGQRWIWGT